MLVATDNVRTVGWIASAKIAACPIAVIATTETVGGIAVTTIAMTRVIVRVGPIATTDLTVTTHLKRRNVANEEMDHVPPPAAVIESARRAIATDNNTSRNFWAPQRAAGPFLIQFTNAEDSPFS